MNYLIEHYQGVYVRNPNVILVTPEFIDNDIEDNIENVKTSKMNYKHILAKTGRIVIPLILALLVVLLPLYFVFIYEDTIASVLDDSNITMLGFIIAMLSMIVYLTSKTRFEDIFDKYL
jgi:hypothetical protein